MAIRRRSASTFSLSFLDIMSCGLGATVLLFLILKHNTETVVVDTELRQSEVNLLQEEILLGEENLARIRNTISELDEELAIAQGLSREIQDEIDSLENEIALLDPVAQESLEELRQRLALLQEQKEILQAEIGGGVRRFLGEGQRQYLTGIRLGGEFVLILLDTSDSMLDETIVNVIRRRVRDDDSKRQAPKWQQAVRIVEWIISNIPVGARFQVVAFNESTAQLVSGQRGGWLATDIRSEVELGIDNLYQLVPDGGTNLYRAFAAIDDFAPRPDNIFLVTDGLPTLGREPPRSSAISSNERYRLFNDAVRLVPERGIPINILLLPMEGDPLAAAAFWQLAQDTRGSFLTPSSDWP